MNFKLEENHFLIFLLYMYIRLVRQILLFFLMGYHFTLMVV